jgi:glycosyltransferase involved in cell wall biosynthesis
MTLDSSKPRILIFIGSLCPGGKERRVIELLTYFKAKGEFEFLVVATRDEIHYKDFHKLNIPYRVIKKKWKKNDPTVIYQFYKICKEFRPHLIHTWGRMQSFYTLPAIVGQRIPLINSQIASAPPKINKWSVGNFIDRLNFHFSKIILSNSQAGIDAYGPPEDKIKVIYNGINMNRFNNLPPVDQIRSKYGIHTPFAVVMAASFTQNKDYRLFLRVAEKVTKIREDVTFIGVGGFYDDDTEYRHILRLNAENQRILFPGKINEVEALVNACDIGILFSNKSVHGEGISNSVMEYMALAKPVVANDAGGTKEIIRNNESGFLIVDQSEDEIANLIIDLINDQKKREAFGKTGKEIIEELFSLDKMGREFEQVYQELLVPYQFQLNSTVYQ